MAAENSTSPPADHAAGSSSQTPIAKKDKQCPFCSQPFTSSSLGRHLDLYIKAVNPKPPDGIHNVDEIRKIRSAITRRHPKGSRSGADTQKERRHSTAERDREREDKQSPPPAPAAQILQNHATIAQSTGRPLSDIYKLQWTATGVINNIPSRDSPSNPSPSQSVPISSTVAPRQEPSASDLALREILQQVSLAQARLKQSKVFDFDFFTCTFPTLVVKLLKPPPASFENLPYHVRDFWPKQTTPGRDCYENVRSRVDARVREAHASLRTLGDTSSALGNRVEDDLRRYLSHVDAVFGEYADQKDPDSAWKFAIMSEIRTEREERRRIEERYDALSAENERLKGELAALGGVVRGVQPAPGAQPVNISDEVAQELARSGFDAGSWNYEALVAKYKGAPGTPAPAATPSNGIGNGSPGMTNGIFRINNSVHAGTKRAAEMPLGARPAPYSRAIRFDDEEDDDESAGHGAEGDEESSPRDPD